MRMPAEGARKPAGRVSASGRICGRHGRIALYAALAGFLAACEPTAISAAPQCLEATLLLDAMPVRTDAADQAVTVTTRYCEPAPKPGLTLAESQELSLAVATLRAEVARTTGEKL